MSDQQRHHYNADEIILPSAKHIGNQMLTEEANIRIQLISIRGGGGGEGQKRKLADIADNDELHNSENDKDFSPSNNESSSNNNITNRLRTRNNITLSSPPKPLPSSSSNTTNTSTPTRASAPPRMDVKSSSVASPGGFQPQKQEAVRDTGSKEQPGSIRIKQEISQAATHGRQQLPDATNQIRKEDAQRQIMKNLESLCDHYSQDIRFAFIPSSSTTNKSRIDLSGSFLRSEDESLDFFDLNEKGEITLQPRPPIFPEELSSSGMKEHSLRWWGVEDPAVADGRFKAAVPQQAAPVMGEDRSRQTMNDNNNYHRGEEYGNGHDRKYNARDPYGGPPPPGGPPYSDRSRGPDRRRDRR